MPVSSADTVATREYVETLDLAQDVFLRVLTRQGQGAPEAIDTPRAYLSTIARGLVVDHWRRRELERAWLETLAALPEALAPAPETQLICLEALIQIDRVLDDLSGDRRLVVLRRGEVLRCCVITTGADAGARGRREFWVETPTGRLRAALHRFALRQRGQHRGEPGGHPGGRRGALHRRPVAPEPERPNLFDRDNGVYGDGVYYQGLRRTVTATARYRF